MNWNRFWVVGFAMVAALWLQGCGTTGVEGGASKRQPCTFDELRLGDPVTISYSDIPSPGWPEQKLRVKDDGTLSLPMNQSVIAAGRRIADVEKDIVKLYMPRYFRQFSVTITAEERHYSVGGEVKNPGRVPYRGEITVMRAIQSCGDFTDFANRRKVEIIRVNGDREVVDTIKARKNPKLDVPICPGDAVHVPQKPF